METAVAFQDLLKFSFSFSEQIHEITFTHSTVKHGGKKLMEKFTWKSSKSLSFLLSWQVGSSLKIVLKVIVTPEIAWICICSLSVLCKPWWPYPLLCEAGKYWHPSYRNCGTHLGSETQTQSVVWDHPEYTYTAGNRTEDSLGLT